MTQPQESGISEETVAIISLAAAEAAFTAAVLAAYRQWLAMVRTALFAVLPVNPGTVWSLVPAWQAAVRLLMDDLENIARQGWEAAAADLDVNIAFNVTNPVLQDQLRRTRNFMLATPDEVYTMILRVLDKNAGSPDAQQRAVEDILNVTGTVNWPARAKTVAATEVHRAFNFGSLAMAMSAGVSVSKRWHARDDETTRPAHHNADGQTRPVFQPFIVGGEALMAPGDPAGSAWNVIQCRCKPSYRRRQSGR